MQLISTPEYRIKEKAIFVSYKQRRFMYPSFSEPNRSIGGVLAALRKKHQPDHASLALV